MTQKCRFIKVRLKKTSDELESLFQNEGKKKRQIVRAKWTMILQQEFFFQINSYVH